MKQEDVLKPEKGTPMKSEELHKGLKCCQSSVAKQLRSIDFDNACVIDKGNYELEKH